MRALGLVLLVAASCWSITDVERAQMLEAHHQVRQSVNPPAASMKLMRYSKKLETLADKWARRCEFEHPNGDEHPEYHALGQNLALAIGFKPPLTEASCGWTGEVKFYQYANDSCSHICDHYTQVSLFVRLEQCIAPSLWSEVHVMPFFNLHICLPKYVDMVWADTTEVGCSMRRCDGLRPKQNNPQYITVCQYSPMGNYIGRKPYTEGPSCSQCAKGEQCYRNQCVKGFQWKRVFPLSKLPHLKDRTMPKCKPTEFYSSVIYRGA
ncbi:unnamed protein product [Hydatigera taeniaeformis]|uniref:SCP domain-containing protein n=1 Tax=Hydatigena taeniaeformis TaxID=6205 RepID=A0A0R3WPJ4_HYDTA|nr:unnamed protein product [Hydatigera taeniaeformis]